jgi:hypothetical protein
MSKKHTPGPWRLNGRAVESPKRMGLSVAQATSGMAAGSRGSARIDEAEAIANARLIAAAPDMLEALVAAKELADVMEGLTSGRSDDEWVWAAQATINAAIAKAEGRS